jgi:23S rRNA (uracil1939-C5)-methyltransferase
MSKQPEPALANILSLSHDGRGIASIQNRTIFINGALPAEVIHYQITHRYRQYHEAQTLAVMTPSPERVTPPCEHFNLCGGCSLQHMSMAMQLQFKQQTLLDQLKHFGRVTPQRLLAPLNLESIHYRRKARLGAKFVIKKSKALVGFREKNSRYLAELQRCIVLHPRIGERLVELSKLIASLEQYQHIPQIEVAMGDDQVALVFRHLQPLTLADEKQLIEFGKKFAFHIYLQPTSPLTICQLWPSDTSQRLSYTLPDFQLELLFHPLHFTQINLEMNRIMVKQAVTLLDINTHDIILDLFCGIGNFTLPIAKQAQCVTGIEGSVEMVTQANDNARHNHIKNAEFYAANLQIRDTSAPWLKKQYDKILLDPPRAGAKDILPLFPQLQAKKIVYISCNPATLARDAGELVHQYGYQLTQVGMINMFPHTSHIEAMAVFDR